MDPNTHFHKLYTHTHTHVHTAIPTCLDWLTVSICLFSPEHTPVGTHTNLLGVQTQAETVTQILLNIAL